jgi:hypothetical protein
MDDKNIYIGGDRLATNGSGMSYHQSKKKVWQKKDANLGIDMIFGTAGSVRGAQLLAYGSAIPPHIQGQTLEEYLIINFTRAMKQALLEGGELHARHGIEQGFNHFLLGTEGRLFSFYEDFCFIEVIEKYTAVGSGSRFALGSLYSTEKTDLTSIERINLALECAEYYDAYVMGQYDIVTIPK